MNYIDINIENFNMDNTFLNGQCFRWNKTPDGSYIGVVGEKAYEIKKIENSIHRIYNAEQEEEQFFKNYFDADNNYEQIEYYLYYFDELLKISVMYGQGMHLLKQDTWEMIISFILSVQKNIPAIKKTIEYLCTRYGKQITYNGKIYYTFPSDKDLIDCNTEDIMQSKCGFRAKGVLDAARKVYLKEVDIKKLPELNDEDAREELKKISGIGDKVSDCILLFSLSRYNCCPVDTWVKAGLDYFYNANKADEAGYRKFAYEKWKDKTGFAQQYMFHYLRNNYYQDKINKKLIKIEKN